MAFYDKALGLKEVRRKEASDGSFILVYLGDGVTGFTWSSPGCATGIGPTMGDNEQHLCMRVEGDYDQMRAYHKEMGAVCYENQEMGLYFIIDPDGYWIEVLP